MKKYAFVLMGDYDTSVDRQDWLHAEMQSSIRTVRDFEEARQVVAELAADGYGCIELCGAFGQEHAQILIEETDGKVAIGYVVHDKEQDALFDQFFG